MKEGWEKEEEGRIEKIFGRKEGRKYRDGKRERNEKRRPKWGGE